MVVSPSRSAHVETFVRDHLPPRQDWPALDLSGLGYPDRINCAAELVDRHVARGRGERVALHFEDSRFSYAELQAWANRIATHLVYDLGVQPGGRVLLRGFNSPWMVAAWLGVVKAGGVVVATMPQLRARELAYIMDKASVGAALCDTRLADEMRAAQERRGLEVPLTLVGDGGFEPAFAHKSDAFQNVDTQADDPVLIAFTSGTTGQPKGAVHFHRDVLAICDTYGKHILRASADDVFAGTPPLAFTYGLGALLVFPMHVGASTVLLEKCTPESLLKAVAEHRITTLFTAPTMYRSLLDHVQDADLASLTTCVSAGEQLPLPTFQAWQSATGLRIVDGIGATELLHIFISAAGDDIRPGATGKVVPGYRAQVIDDDGAPVGPDVVGRLAVQGPTGCRYLDDPERQRQYVHDGWNLTGDAYKMDADGYFWYQARTDDMIISAGYNIAGPEVENVLLDHPKVRECAVVGVPDETRGRAVKAFVVLRDPGDASDETVHELQEFVKSEIAPYKYPRQVEFVETLPRTETGKLQRYKLRDPE